MIRKIIRIDEEKCNGCGACASACHEGAIQMIEGKAKLVHEHYCDGLGDCLPACPTNAISFEMREAPAYDEEAVRRAKEMLERKLPCGCPGSQVQSIERSEPVREAASAVESRLGNWPVQIKLAPESAPFFDGADLLIAADCTAYAYGNFHAEFIKGRVVLVGCPKLDGVNYADKLARILINNDIRNITLVRMQVPCCGGLQYAAETALQASGKDIPLNVVPISTNGIII